MISFKTADRANLVMEARIWSADLTHRERFGRSLMILNKVFDGLLELLDRVMIASLDLLLTELGKPALDLIDQRTMGWGKPAASAGAKMRPIPQSMKNRMDPRRMGINNVLKASKVQMPPSLPRRRAFKTGLIRTVLSLSRIGSPFAPSCFQ